MQQWQVAHADQRSLHRLIQRCMGFVAQGLQEPMVIEEQRGLPQVTHLLQFAESDDKRRSHLQQPPREVAYARLRPSPASDDSADMPEHESKLRRLHTHCFACSTAYASDQGNCTSCGYDLRGYIRVERISKNHAQMLSLLDGIRLVLKLSDPQVAATQRQIVRMAIERQASISSDHAAVAEFWEVYDYLESLSEDPVVDHSSDPTVIAINLNEFCERAAEHKQKLADVATLRDLLKESRSRKFLDSNKAVHSAVRAAFNNRTPCSQPRPTTVKCWTFKA